MNLRDLTIAVSSQPSFTAKLFAVPVLLHKTRKKHSSADSYPVFSALLIEHFSCWIFISNPIVYLTYTYIPVILHILCRYTMNLLKVTVNRLVQIKIPQF